MLNLRNWESFTCMSIVFFVGERSPRECDEDLLWQHTYCDARFHVWHPFRVLGFVARLYFPLSSIGLHLLAFAPLPCWPVPFQALCIAAAICNVAAILHGRATHFQRSKSYASAARWVRPWFVIVEHEWAGNSIVLYNTERGHLHHIRWIHYITSVGPSETNLLVRHTAIFGQRSIKTTPTLHTTKPHDGL